MVGKKIKRWLSVCLTGMLLLGLLSGCSVELGDVDDVIGEMDMTYGTAEEYEKEVIRLVNQEREKRGLSPLTTNDAIMAAAHARLKELDIEPSHTRWNPLLHDFARVRHFALCAGRREFSIWTYNSTRSGEWAIWLDEFSRTSGQHSKGRDYHHWCGIQSHKALLGPDF